MKKRLSIRLLVSLAVSAVLFCMPVGAFIANRGNTLEIHAQDTDSSEESSAETTEAVTDSVVEESSEESTEGSTEEETAVSGNDAKEAECICDSKCSGYSINEKCEVCKEDETKCEYVNPNVKITIQTPSGWHNDSTKVKISVEDVAESGNFTIQSVKAKIAQNGSWTDITEDMFIEISENATIYVQVTDQKGKTYEKNRYIKCFDFTKPTLNAAVSDGLLSVQAHDTDSGIKAVYVNGYEFTDLTNGSLNIRLQQFDAGYQNFTIQAMDNAGNLSEVYKSANPYYTDPEKADSNESNPAEQLPVSAAPSVPSSATAQVTEHTNTDSNGNTVSQSNPNTGSSAGTEKEGEETDSEKGKEFYTIQTASEKVFYLIIDRDGDEEMVYFLTEVSESDLLNTTAENSETLPKNSAALESAIPTTEGALSNNNAEAVEGADKEAVTEETETEESTEAEPEAKPQAQENPMTGYILMGIAAVAVIGGAYYFKVVRRKKEDFLDEDEDDEEEEYEEDVESEETEDDFFNDTAEEDEE